MKHEILERHEVIVPCALSPSGKHSVRFVRGVFQGKVNRESYRDDNGNRVVAIECDCVDLKAAETASLLGQHTCGEVLMALRASLAEKEHPWGTRFDGRFPDGFNAFHVQGYSDKHLRESRKVGQRDKRPLFVRLTEKRFWRLSKMRLTVSQEANGTRKLLATTGHRFRNKDVVAVAISPRGSRQWEINNPELTRAAKYIGYAGDVCLVCDLADPHFNRIEQHTRGTEHIRNVVYRVRATLAQMAGLPIPDKLVRKARSI